MSVKDPDTQEILAFAHRLADAAAAVTKAHFRSQMAVEDKDARAEFDPVTIADRDAEAAMRALIRETYPDHAILGEEGGSEGGGAHCWVLDPIDGTRSFISGFPTWGTLIAYARDGRPLVGMMDQPITGERFTGAPDGAFLGEKRLKARPCAALSEATLFSTTPDMFEGEEITAFARLERQVKLRRFGGDCYSYCMLAAGYVDLVVEAALAPYDIQALIPIIEGAGGIVTTWDGQDAASGGRVVAACNPDLHAAAMAVLNGD